MSSDDELLIKKALHGDIDAFEDIVYKYEKMIYSVAFRMFNDKQDAEDLTQEVFIKLFKSLKSISKKNNLKSWLYTVAYNASIDEIRRRKGKNQISSDDNAESFINTIRSDKPGPEEEAINKEKTRILENAIACLGEKHKSLIILRDIDGLSYNEISEITNQSLGTIKSGISRARKNLREILEKSGEIKDYS